MMIEEPKTEQPKPEQPKTEKPAASAGEAAEAGAGEPPKETPKKSLFSRIGDALKQDKRTRGLHSLHLKVSGAVVFLDGETRTPEEREAAEEIVRKVEGVHLVQNRLQVNPHARSGGWREKHKHG